MSAIGWALIVLGLLIVGWIIVQASGTISGGTQSTSLTPNWQAYPAVPSTAQPTTFKVKSFYTGSMFKV